MMEVCVQVESHGGVCVDSHMMEVCVDSHMMEVCVQVESHDGGVCS